MNQIGRDISIDLAKGLAISSVVLGHVLEAGVLSGGGAVEKIGYHWIYAFHMPFWFLLSGYLYREAQDPWAFFKKKFFHLMVPYLAWLVVFNGKAIAGFGVNLVRGMTPEKWHFYGDYFFNQAYGGELVGGAQMVLWFPVCLFFTQQMGNLLFRLVPNHFVRWGIGLIVFLLGYANQFFAPDFRLPLALNVVAGALPFFLVGHSLRSTRSRSFSVLVTAATLFVMTGIALRGWPLQYHMRMAEYGWPIISTLGAIGGFLGLLAVCRGLTKLPGIKWVSVLGGASMTIMYLHVIVLQILCGQGWGNWPLLLAGGVLIPTAIHLALLRIGPMARVFLGVSSPKVSPQKERSA